MKKLYWSIRYVFAVVPARALYTDSAAKPMQFLRSDVLPEGGEYCRG